ncbi:MAG TPA: zinc ribbon domain-containing protein [Edaphobacter sp.]|nr:zinc ribbon domain-containing protein [Edaphobacter sp.]
MYKYCHRCGEELSGGDDRSPFCPHCGAPQLYLPDYERPVETSEPNTTGAPPPPQPRQIEWKTAIRCAMVVAAIAAALTLVATRFESVSLLSWLWTVSGSLITLAFYQRRRPAAWMDAGVGARIGVVAGVVLVCCLAVAMAAGGLIARYALHNMASFDAQLTQQLHTQIEHAISANPEAKAVRGYLYSPEFRAGVMLTGFAMMAAVLLVLSTIGGAVGGLLGTRRKPSV